MRASTARARPCCHSHPHPHPYPYPHAPILWLTRACAPVVIPRGAAPVSTGGERVPAVCSLCARVCPARARPLGCGQPDAPTPRAPGVREEQTGGALVGAADTGVGAGAGPDTAAAPERGTTRPSSSPPASSPPRTRTLILARTDYNTYSCLRKWQHVLQS